MSVASIETDSHGSGWFEPLNQFGNLLEAAAERKLRAGRVLNENVKWSFLPRKAVDGATDGVSGQGEAFIAR